MDTSTPVVFSDGTSVFNKLKEAYITHSTGRFILSSSGTGKTHYIKSQSDKHWIDGDYFWPLTNADLLHDDWEHDFELVMEVNSRCDAMTYQAKKQGLWILGSSNNWLKPDAIVKLDEDTQRDYIRKRQKNGLDGGATDRDFEGVLRHNAFIMRWAEQDVPVFDSVELAANYFISLE